MELRRLALATADGHVQAHRRNRWHLHSQEGLQQQQHLAKPTWALALRSLVLCELQRCVIHGA